MELSQRGSSSVLGIPVNLRPSARFIGLAPALLICSLANDFRSLAPALCAGLAATLLVYMIRTLVFSALGRHR